MRTSLIILTLSVTALAACSGGQGPDSGTSNSPPPNPSPPPPPGATPTPPPPPAATPTPPPTYVGTLSCSPCTKIAFQSTSAQGNQIEIYTVDADGTDLTRLTDNDAYDGEPAWSPDGQRIAFVSNRDLDSHGTESWKNEVYVMDADGGNVRRLTFSASGAWSPAWSPDGGRIAYATVDNGSSNLWEIPVDGGAPQLLFSTPGVDMQPTWSPDGTRLAIVSDWFAYDFVWDIFLINDDGTGFTAVTDGNIFDKRDYYEPAWSPDGDRIALTISDRLGTYEYATQIGVMDANGLALRALWDTGERTLSGEDGASPSWSPDGTVIAFTSCDSSGCAIAWITDDGSTRGDIVRNATHPDWQR